METAQLTKVVGFLAGILFLGGHAAAERELHAARTSQPPVLDGSGEDPAWAGAKAIEVADRRSGDPVALRAVYDDDAVYFLVRFPDPQPDLLHKPWVWDDELELYSLGPQREDTFSFRWLMGSEPVDLSTFSDDDYTADVWYWKANRTNPAGYSDDKLHVLAGAPGKKAQPVKSRTGKSRYLMRLGDAGTPAQQKRLLTERRGAVEDQYETQEPDGSRADVRARGAWADGHWTIEFARSLNTGHDDDVQFDPDSRRRHLFGVSIYGLYGEPVDDGKAHLYGQGRLSEPLLLIFD